MTRRLLPMLLVGVVILAGLSGADEPAPDKGEGPPLRLKRKKRADPPADKEKAPGKPKEKAPAEKAKEDEPLVPEDGPAGEDEDEKDVLERIARNMRAVEEKLGNRELGEPTAQQQRDILRDIDALIKKSQQQQQQGGGGAADQQPQGGDGEKGRQSAQQRGSRGSSGGQRSMARNSGGRRQQRGSGRGQRGERKGREKGNSGRAMAGTQPGSRGGQQPRPGAGMPQGGMNPGRGGTGPDSLREINTETYKDVWGHLPESLRAEMNAYSNPQPFLPRYDRLIREYYKAIAEQGRKKGE